MTRSHAARKKFRDVRILREAVKKLRENFTLSRVNTGDTANVTSDK